MVEYMKKKDMCIIHIGMPKTGSSALQESLFTNIIDNRVSYANLPVSNHSAIIFSMFASRPESHSLHQGMKHSKEDIVKFNEKNKKLLIDSFSKNNTNIEIISGEDIFHIDYEGLKKMKFFLETYFKKILIVGYVRAPKSFMESAFQQLVKNHKMDSFDFSIIYPYYKDKLEKFDTVFGSENVYLWKFDPKIFPKGDITLDFCKRLDIKTDDKLALRSNDAISEEAIALLFANHKYGKQFDFSNKEMQINNKLIEEISIIGKKKFKFSPKLINDVLSKYEADLKWIEDRMGLSLSEDTYELNQGITSEEELLIFSDSTLNQLKELIGIDFLPIEKLEKRPEDVAKLVDALKIKIASDLKVNFIDSENNIIISNKRKKREYALLKKYDIDWSRYCEMNEINDGEIDPIEHYIENWYFDDLKVGDNFQTSFYLNEYKDIKEAKINPLLHYMQHGIKEGRKGRMET